MGILDRLRALALFRRRDQRAMRAQEILRHIEHLASLLEISAVQLIEESHVTGVHFLMVVKDGHVTADLRLDEPHHTYPRPASVRIG